MNPKISVEWRASGRGKAQCPSNPDYPEGITLRTPTGFGCLVDLPYPAPECGAHILRCKACGSSAAVTAAGRPDDPISFQMMCHLQGGKQ